MSGYARWKTFWDLIGEDSDLSRSLDEWARPGSETEQSAREKEFMVALERALPWLQAKSDEAKGQ